MLGQIAYVLEALEDGSFDIFTGKLQHGAFFQYLETFSPDLLEALHEANLDPFTLAPLEKEVEAGKPLSSDGLSFRRGERLLFRVTALSDAVLAAALSMPADTEIVIGRNAFFVKETIADGRLGTGVLAPEDIVAGALEHGGEAHEFTMDFRSPTVFRVGHDPYPFPTPALIFASLYDRWRLTSLPAPARELIVLLTQFAPFAGTGRLTAQGFGNVKVTLR